MRKLISPIVTVPSLLTAAALWRLTARYLAGFTAIIRRSPEHTSVAVTDGFWHCDNGYRPLSGNPLRYADYTPGGVFDPLFAGLPFDIAGISAAISRHPGFKVDSTASMASLLVMANWQTSNNE
jgi:hypothetical protein